MDLATTSENADGAKNLGATMFFKGFTAPTARSFLRTDCQSDYMSNELSTKNLTQQLRFFSSDMPVTIFSNFVSPD